MFDEASQKAIIDKASSWDGSMESGQAVNLLPGESIEAPDPGRPNPAFDPFWTAMVRQIGMALEMPFEVLVAHFQSSYSAARAALLMAWKAFRRRRDRLVTYPEIISAEIEGPEVSGNKTVYKFRRAVGTKGAAGLLHTAFAAWALQQGIDLPAPRHEESTRMIKDLAALEKTGKLVAPASTARMIHASAEFVGAASDSSLR